MRKAFAVSLAVVALVAAFAGTAFAADYTSEIGAASTTILADLATNVPAAVALGLGLFGVMTGIIVLFRALKKARSAGS